MVMSPGGRSGEPEEERSVDKCTGKVDLRDERKTTLLLYLRCGEREMVDTLSGQDTDKEKVLKLGKLSPEMAFKGTISLDF